MRLSIYIYIYGDQAGDADEAKKEGQWWDLEARVVAAEGRCCEQEGLLAQLQVCDARDASKRHLVGDGTPIICILYTCCMPVTCTN
jgi:hypothetical protein